MDTMMTQTQSLSKMHACRSLGGLSTWPQSGYTRAIENDDRGGSR